MYIDMWTWVPFIEAMNEGFYPERVSIGHEFGREIYFMYDSTTAWAYLKTNGSIITYDWSRKTKGLSTKILRGYEWKYEVKQYCLKWWKGEPILTNYDTEFLIGRMSVNHMQLLYCWPSQEGNNEQIVVNKQAAFDYMMSKVLAVNFLE